MRLRRHSKTFVLIAIVASLGGSVAGARSILFPKTGTPSSRGAGSGSGSASVGGGGSDAQSGGLVPGRSAAAANVENAVFAGGRPAAIYVSESGPSGGHAGIVATHISWQDPRGFGPGSQSGHDHTSPVTPERVTPSAFQWGLQWTATPASSEGVNSVFGGSMLPAVPGMGSGGTSAISPALLISIDNPNRLSTTARVSAITAPVPEPAEWMMLVAGFVVIGFIARRRQQIHR